MSEIKNVIHGCGYFRKRARFLIKLAKDILKDHAGVVPDNAEDLQRLTGVGPKTAILFLNHGFAFFAGKENQK